MWKVYCVHLPKSMNRRDSGPQYLTKIFGLYNICLSHSAEPQTAFFRGKTPSPPISEENLRLFYIMFSYSFVETLGVTFFLDGIYTSSWFLTWAVAGMDDTVLTILLHVTAVLLSTIDAYIIFQVWQLVIATYGQDEVLRIPFGFALNVVFALLALMPVPHLGLLAVGGLLSFFGEVVGGPLVGQKPPRL